MSIVDALENPVMPEGWHINYNPKPIPDRRHDYDFYYDNYDGVEDGNGLCGTAESVQDAIEQIGEFPADCI